MNRTTLLLAILFAGQTVRSAGDAPRVESPLIPVSNPPPVQMLAPGFTVRELPLALNNINNLVYAPDGRLFALCYDGNVLQLTDTNGDGLEDTATHFFRNTGNEIPASIGMAWGPGGLYIASQGRVIHLRDKGDGSSELKTVTEGWVPPTGIAGSNLDSIGLAVDSAGNIFFGLGCDNWREAYRVNKETGNSEYNIRSERGTILKISPDWKTREIVCTGTRFPVSLAFNAAGDLFCTDQEGATWLPNGNPFDELLHIIPGRHYGFPPRHPKHLPDVIDEPSVFDYGPQHQSTCGLHFNEPSADGTVFGPDWWRGDALIAGQARGKIFRTKLVRTAAGYVAQNHLIACLAMLTLDAVPTPQGDLLVACHSGKPDWGTGPQGKGKLFKISYTDRNAPQPVLAYAASPSETRIVFDRAIVPGTIRDFAKHSGVESGRYVAAGDRFESFSPGYQAVKNQRTMPRFAWPVLSATLDPGRRALVIQTAPRTEAVNYAVTLPGFGQAERAHDPKRNELPQHAAIDLLTDLTGVETVWRSANGRTNWTGWLPHPDTAAARGFTGASESHQRLFQRMTEPGTLTLRAQLDLWQMLRAATQPGSKLDFDYPPETVTVVFQARSRLNVRSQARVTRLSDHESRVTVEPESNRWTPIDIVLTTGAAPGLEVSWFTSEDSRPRPLPLRRIFLPWARPHVPLALVTQVPEIDGGDWERGRKIYFGDQAACFKCHRMNGEGGTMGPDLSNLVYRDYASVLKDIVEPGAAINPDHIGYNVELKDGGVESGVLLGSNAERVILGQATGENITIPRTNVAGMTASTLSVMPEGLLDAFDAQQRKDLMTFLLTRPDHSGVETR